VIGEQNVKEKTVSRPRVCIISDFVAGNDKSAGKFRGNSKVNKL